MNLPALHGNWVDLLIIVFLLFYAWEGFERGFLALLAEMGSFVLSFLAGLRFYPFAAKLLIDNFTLSRGVANALGFVLIVVGTEVVLGVVTTSLYRLIPPRWLSSWWNRTLGFLPAVVDGLILVSFLLTALVGLPVSGAIKYNVLNSRLGSALVRQTRGLEKSLSQVFGGAIQETLNFLTVKTGSRETVDLRFKTSELAVDAASEQTMLRLVNQARFGHGLGPLTMDVKLQQVARAHSRDMFVRGYFSHVDPDGHDPFDRMRAAGIQFETAGENLAYAPSVEIAHEGLMNSPGHRANILNPDFGKVGLGVIDGGVYGKMFTQEFTN